MIVFEKGVGCLGYAGLKTNEMIFFFNGNLFDKGCFLFVARKPRRNLIRSPTKNKPPPARTLEKTMRRASIALIVTFCLSLSDKQSAALIPTLSRRRILGTTAMLPVLPVLASDGCVAGCLRECTKLAPGDQNKAYCLSNCEDYCQQAKADGQPVGGKDVVREDRS